MKIINIKDRFFEKDYPTLIIAEVGVNHNGSVGMAKKLVDSAQKCGADAVKFQTYKTEDLITKDAKKAEYQIKNSDEGSQFEMLKKLELSSEDFVEINQHALEKKITLLSSPFDNKSVDLLDELGMPLFKIASGEITNLPLIKRIAKKEKPIILSTGMANLCEIEEAVKLIEKYNNELILMHCVTNYPSKPEDTNLNVIQTLKNTFKKPTGFSDHSPGIEMPIAAVALGSCVIEKHFTLDKTLSGPDHKASLEPHEFARMVRSIRNVENGLGNGIKKLTDDEIKIKKLVRKSLVAKEDIPKGTRISGNMVTIKRPGTGIEPKFFNLLIGKKTKSTINKDTVLKWDQLE